MTARKKSQDIIAKEEIDRLQNVQLICNRVAEGLTIREIAKEIGCSAGHVLTIVTKDEQSEKQYARAREAAADLFETDIIEACIASTPATAASDRVKIDGFKWVAGRRSPKRYGDKMDLTSSDKSMSPIDISPGMSALYALMQTQPVKTQ